MLHLIVLLIVSIYSIGVQSHGMMVNPPARNTIWREGFPNPKNYDDNALNCGGFAVQFGQNGGRCGVCGDPYQGPRPHEVGFSGGYANGIIGRTYKPGQTIPVEIKITANHVGIFQFRLCPNDDPNTAVTQDCLDRYVLSDVDGKTKFELLSSVGNASVGFTLKLPTEVTCTACVLQWWWTAGNNNGPPGTKQENFVNCADVAITDGGNPPSQQPLTRKPPIYPRQPDESSVTGKLEGTWDCEVVPPYNTGANAIPTYNWCISSCINVLPQDRHCPSTHCHCFRTDVKLSPEEERRQLLNVAQLDSTMAITQDHQEQNTQVNDNHRDNYSNTDTTTELYSTSSQDRRRRSKSRRKLYKRRRSVKNW